MDPLKSQHSPGIFEYQSLDHISLLNYQEPSKGLGARPALEFYGGAPAGSSASNADLRSEIMTPTSDVMSSFDGSEGTVDPLKEWEIEVLKMATGTSAPRNFPEQSFARHSASIAAKAANNEATMSGRTTEGLCYQLEALKLAQCRRSLAQAEEELALARKTIGLMQNQNVHLAQELAAAVNGGRWGKALRGKWPGLVHVDSVPLLTTRISFNRYLGGPPQVVVGMQTSVPSAIVLVCTSKVDCSGFTVHAELANAEEVRCAGHNLLKCLVIWMAFGDLVKQNNRSDHEVFSF